MFSLYLNSRFQGIRINIYLQIFERLNYNKQVLLRLYFTKYFRADSVILCAGGFVFSFSSYCRWKDNCFSIYPQNRLFDHYPPVFLHHISDDIYFLININVIPLIAFRCLNFLLHRGSELGHISHFFFSAIAYNHNPQPPEYTCPDWFSLSTIMEPFWIFSCKINRLF